MKRGISPSSSIISLFRVHPMLSQLFPLPAATHSEHHAQCRKYNVDEHGRGLPVLPASNVAVFSMNAHCVQSGLQYAVVDLLYTLFAVFPETSCQGLFNQIHKKATKKVPEALSCS